MNTPLLAPQWLEETPSTNTTLAARVKEGTVPHGAVLAAVRQTAGRGRFDRRWISRPGLNLTFSLFWQTAAGFPQIASAPLAAGLGVAEFLRTRHGIDGRVKWPNDVMVADQKICGILSERVAAGTAAATGGIVVGIGVNLNLTAEDAQAIGRPATSVLLETGQAGDVRTELDALLQPVGRRLALWEEGGFPALRAEMERFAWRIGQPVTVGDGAAQQEGVLRGFGDSGELLLTLADGTVRPCWSGDFAY